VTSPIRSALCAGYVAERQHRGTGGDAGGGNNALAKPLVAVGPSQLADVRSGDDVTFAWARSSAARKNLGVVKLL